MHPERVEEPAQHVGGLGGAARRRRSRAGWRRAARRGSRCATRCAQCSASAVFPTPAVPPIAEITTPVLPRPGVAEHGVEQPQFAGPAGEVRHGVGSCLGTAGSAGTSAVSAAAVAVGRRRQGRQGRLVTRRPVSRDQLRPCRVRQPERADQRPHRTRVRPARPSPLHVRDGPHADPGPLGQVLLGQPGSDPLPAQPQPRWLADPCRVHDHPPARDQPVTVSLTAGTLPGKCSL